MSGEKFTPGPWYVEEDSGYFDIRAEGRVWPIVGNEGCDEEPNAHLIAAAPELYSVATNVVSVLDENFRLSGRDDDYIYDELGSSLSSLYFEARSAAAKARGES